MLVGGHLGRDKTYHKIAERFYWKTLWTDVQQYVQQCETCQTTNDAKFQKAAAPLHPIPVKSKVWNQVISYLYTSTLKLLFFVVKLLVCSQHLILKLIFQVGIDLIGPLPKTERGNRYIVTLVDFFSKWPEAEPLQDKTAKSVALFLYKMICRYVSS